MKRRLKITVTHTRRTIASERSPVLHVVCPDCASTAEMRTVADSNEVMETDTGAMTVLSRVPTSLSGEAVAASAKSDQTV